MNFTHKLLIITSVSIVSLLSLLTMNSSKGGNEAEQQHLMMYCAVGVKPPILKAVSEFEKHYNVKVNLQYGGSGLLLNNLRIFNRGDLYLAADSSFLDIATENGLVKESLPLAEMTPMVAVQKNNPLGIRDLKDLLRKDIRLSLGNPETASIGKQVKLLLESAGIWEKVKTQVEERGVFKPTVTEVANDIKIGAVDAGIIWDATVSQYDTIDGVEVVEFDQAQKMVTIGILSSSLKPNLALRFAQYLNSREGNRFFKEEGYRPVEGDIWTWPKSFKLTAE